MAQFPRRDSDEHAMVVVPRWAIIGVFLIALTYFVAEARSFLMPVMLAFLLFFVFTPFRRYMQKLGVSSTLTAAVVTLGMILAVGGLGMAASAPISRVVDNMPTISQRLKDRFGEMQENLRPIQEAAEQIDAVTSGGGAEATIDTGGGLGETEEPVPTATPGEVIPPDATVIADGSTATVTADMSPTTVSPDGIISTGSQDITVQIAPSSENTAAARLMSLGPAFLGQTVFTLVLLFFMIASGDLLYLKIVQSFDRMRDKRRAYAALREIEDSLGAYLSAITIINACLGFCIGVAMWLWGMPSPLLFGLAGFLLNFIPYLGAIFGTIMSAVIALFIFPDLWNPMLVAATYMALTAVEGQLITPYFVSRRLKMNEVVVFLTVALWAWLWSVLGMVVAVPVLVVLRVLCAHIPGMEKFGNFLSGGKPPQLEDEDEDTADTGPGVPKPIDRKSRHAAEELATRQ
ncbi:AI-2E family transporter [Paracoccus sp. TK19116]|uniref:AI-2E family transporter n=1 Tax=Paracoccus albicereus TaxID=2922394 RepID=A0ABT1MSP1_9RHOB|nr:AI-2E family transporter [Paracoccus albicereus]MCQ0971332.1 AI-2E family transporter [Paracoccus albicereus]